jgi:hypothetical protein
MADLKISALPASTTPLAGTEVLPIVQSGATKQVSVANLTAGRAISATSVTATTGNFVVGTSGQGIDFSATPSTGTSELLADYEEGTFTPSITIGGATTGITYTSQQGWYTKTGRVVHAAIQVLLSSKGASTGSVRFAGLPFASSAAPFDWANGTAPIFFTNMTVSKIVMVVCPIAGSTGLYANALSVAAGNNTIENILNTDIANDTYFRFSVVYFV